MPVMSGPYYAPRYGWVRRDYVTHKWTGEDRPEVTELVNDLSKHETRAQQAARRRRDRRAEGEEAGR
jgi:hypothetical protein